MDDCPRCTRNGHEVIGRAVKGLMFNGEELCMGCAKDLLDPILEEPEKASREQLEQGFVLASQRTHPDLDDQMEW